MAIVDNRLRNFIKLPPSPTPIARVMAQTQLGGLTKARMGVPSPSITSPIQSQINLAQSMGRTPNISAPAQDVSASTLPAQPAQPDQTNLAPPDASGNLSVPQYVSILTTLPKALKVQPLRIVFTPPALTDFATKAQQSNMPNTASKVSAASQGSNITTIEVEVTAASELQQAQGEQANPPNQLNVLQSKLAQAGRNPFVNMNQKDLAQLHDLNPSAFSQYIGGQGNATA